MFLEFCFWSFEVSLEYLKWVLHSCASDCWSSHDACPVRTLQIAIIDCIFWFHSRVSNFQQVWEKKGAEPQCNIAFFFLVVPSIHVAAIAASSCHSLTSATAAALSSEVTLATATAQLQAGQVLCRWAQHGFCKFGTSLFRALHM